MTAVGERGALALTTASTLRTRPGERLADVWEEQADRLPDHPAVEADGEALTFDQLDRRANRLARFLLAQGLQAGDRIGLVFDRPVESYTAMLAVLKINAVYVPLDPAFPPDRLAYILGDADARTVLSLSSVTGLDHLPVRILRLDNESARIEEQDDSRLTGHERRETDLAYIIYTSGSTGRPKGVAIEHASICNFVRVAAETYGIEPGARVYQGMTLAFDFSVEEIWVPWLSGATVVPKPPGANLLGHELHRFLTERRITGLCCVPTLLATVEEDLPALDFLLVSGEACPQDLVARWHRPGRRFLNVYGPTEATVTATWTTLAPGKPVTIGVPLPTYSAVILDPDDPGRALPPGTIGEIGLAGPGLAAGYLGREDLTAKAFVPDFLDLPANPSGRIYRTGDLGRIGAEGEIEYHGRVDLQVKIRGYRIELTEIESVLMELPGVGAAVVDTWEPTPGNVELVGYYTARSGVPAVRADDLLAVLRDRLPAYMVPAYLERLPRIPLTPQDKVDRRALPVPSHRRAPADDAYAAPENDVEETLARALARTLGLARVSAEAHFFADLGANSLLLARFAAALRKDGAVVAPSMREIYGRPTIRQLAAVLRPAEPSLAPAGTIARTRGGRYVCCGVLQLLTFLGYSWLGAFATFHVYLWISAAGTTNALLARAAAAGSAAVVTIVMVPILLKWMLVGRWKPGEFPLWGLRYYRFWLVKTAITMNPVVLLAGTPVYVWYLRLLGARIGRGATVLSRIMPIVTDLVSIGDGALVRRDVTFPGYRAEPGKLRLGTVSIGEKAFVGEMTVLDIETVIGAGAQLGHSSSLTAGQSIPDGASWHGTPARPAEVNYRRVEPLPTGRARRTLFSLVLVGAPLLALAVVVALLAAFADTTIFVRALEIVRGSGSFQLLAAVLSMGVFLAGALAQLMAMVIVPRILHRFVVPGKIYPLYGFHHLITMIITAMTNSPFFMRLFGDASTVVGYLRKIGYRMPGVVQTGSNFGTELRQDAPLLSTVGRGTMVSDSLSVVNMDYSATSFRMSPVEIGAWNFLGNDIAYPAGARVGDNVLLGTKVMVPIDGPVRENVGLLGSPCFEIPRSVARDAEFGYLARRAERRRRLRRKNRYNTVSLLLFLLVRTLQVGVSVLLAEYALLGLPGMWGLFCSAVTLTLFTLLYPIAIERLALGRKRLTPQFVSIYDPYFWWHERLWKLSSPARLNGTPFKVLFWRLLGVRIGRRVFDDGCDMPERTPVTIGDDAVLNFGCTIQCHSLEDGSFKSDYTTIGSGAVLGVKSFVHYGVTMGDGSALEADAFLMKGEQVAPFTRWAGNPAAEIPSGEPPRQRRPSDHPTPAQKRTP
ncbi:Pls/PosA family non-ribosomal peptide synthetase [Amycolatopsis sp. GM8]|uniref:Pls/PosA family non-ribosomal peptide synthetase n=1 Tax=Amycolatopsis sp. GM8 TaxID=2896530 RepID=UPI001F2F0B9C|nr:Pls/PosA family non-ribosomal peptide synthetase [Amycolatopsis sp. GM8]